VVGQLIQAYFESKHDLESSFLEQNCTHESAIPASNHKSGAPVPTFDVIKRALSRSSFKSLVAHNCPYLGRVKSGPTIHPYALTFLGPTITQIKTDLDVESSLFLFEYRCKMLKCPRQMWVQSPGDSPFSGPVTLRRISTCSRLIITWAAHYKERAAKLTNHSIQVVSPKLGLHPLVKAYTDILSMTSLDPKEISRKIQAEFAMDPMFIQSRYARDVITKQIRERICLICREEGGKDPLQKNSAIQYTHDVVTFKENHLLRLPDDFKPQLIQSETLLLEVARRLEKSSHMCGKKDSLQSDSPHCDLIVLEYDDVEDTPHYKHLDAR
jgi:hypothetical protein